MEIMVLITRSEWQYPNTKSRLVIVGRADEHVPEGLVGINHNRCEQQEPQRDPNIDVMHVG